MWVKLCKLMVLLSIYTTAQRAEFNSLYLIIPIIKFYTINSITVCTETDDRRWTALDIR